MTYNWTLWDNFQAAAKELNLELRSQDGGCVYMEVPEPVRQKFYVMCWTPLNKLDLVTSGKGSVERAWLRKLDSLRQNHTDFHLEFGAKQYVDGSMHWFPNFGIGNTPSKDQIINAVKVMMDLDNFEKYKLMAIIRQESE